MTTRSITDTFNDAGLTPVQKATEMSFAAKGDTQRMDEYVTLRNGHKTKFQDLKVDAENLFKSSLLSEVEQVAEAILVDGLAAGEAEDHARSLRNFEARASEGRAMLQDIQAAIKPLTENFKLLQATEDFMVAVAHDMRNESSAAVTDLRKIETELPKFENRLQDTFDAIGMAWNTLSDVRDHQRREAEMDELRDFLGTGRMSTDKPVTAPAPARFRRGIS